MPTLFGLFDDAKAAQKAADTLVAHGIAKDHVHVLTKADHAGLADLKNSLEADDVHFYTDSVNDGGTLLVVDALQKQVGDVAETLHKYGMVDVEHRAAEYAKKHGKKALREHQEEDYVLPVIEESLEVGKRAVERGRVRVYNRITERAVEEKVGLRDETIHVERRVVNRPVDITADLFQERSFEVVEIDEEAIVSKVARVIEEVVVSKEVAENIQTIKDTVRRSDVEIEKVAAVRTFDDFHGDFKTYFTSHLEKSGHKFDKFLPAFKFGHTLANSEKFAKLDWAHLEAGAKKTWEEKNPGTWTAFHDAVKHAFEKARA